jgi:hypothetical protein
MRRSKRFWDKLLFFASVCLGKTLTGPHRHKKSSRMDHERSMGNFDIVLKLSLPAHVTYISNRLPRLCSFQFASDDLVAMNVGTVTGYRPWKSLGGIA